MMSDTSLALSVCGKPYCNNIMNNTLQTIATHYKVALDLIISNNALSEFLCHPPLQKFV